MKKTVSDLKKRIELIKDRDPVENAKIIKKLERKIRAMAS